MKTIFYSIITLVLFSCHEKTKTANMLEGLKLTVDTVMVDPGDSFFNLKYGLDLSDISESGKILIFMERDNKNLYQIDLETLKILSKTQFETEGPNGIGPFVTTMSRVFDDNLYFGTYKYGGIFNPEGIKIDPKTIQTDQIKGKNGESEMSFHYSPVLSNNGKFAYSLPRNEDKDTFSFSWFDFETNQGEVTALTKFDSLTQFTIQVIGGSRKFKLMESAFVQAYGENVVIRTPGYSDIYLFNSGTKHLSHKAFPHQIVPTRRDHNFNGKIESMQEISLARARLFEDILFEEFLFDDESKYFFRFGARKKPKLENSKSEESEVFLFIYDEDFNLLGETKIDDLKKVPEYPFFKDGKLWSYVNVEDELGFAVFTFDF
ncbi:hypothetical protein FHS59_002056 [Algoriphagus iocasae]|uniref:DUF4221 domain-containing protein n=1 Tax=Algoriphagus iocasae TaxID=1836499 RepID=A0A841MV16_9BACT|nr:DUF4221 family protein [Algoriphagus iocasae]MBB6326428.1 hypothetical protein [Algoriphagus iocasae]